MGANDISNTHSLYSRVEFFTL